MEFPGLSSHGLLQNSGNHGWRHVKNLDAFYKSMYRLYAEKGLYAVILSEACSIISLGFTIGISVFIIAFLNWEGLLRCEDEESCSAVNGNFSVNPFHHSPTLFSLLIALYFILFGTLWVVRCIAALQVVSDAFEMEEFYRVQLNITTRDLQNLLWYQIVERFIALHDSGTFCIAVKEKITVEDIILRIMRKENYLIALVNKNVLDLFLPWWMSPFFWGDNLILTKSMEWSLSFCITENMFTDHFDLAEQFVQDVEGLQHRFQVLGLLHFLLLPFMLLFMTIHFFLQNAQQFHSNRAYLGPRQWSNIALWQFREFNELPHILEERMNKAYSPGLSYLNSFHNPYITIVAKCMSYIFGALLGCLLLISLLSDGALIYVHVLDHNLLWYLGVFSAFFAAFRSLIPDESKAVENREEVLAKMCAATHHYPPHWVGAADTLPVRDEVADLLQFKIQLFFTEILSVLVTPAVLCFSLPRCVPALLSFIRKHTAYVDGVGAVCDFSLFDFDRHGDSTFGSDHVKDQDCPNDGKLEKSFLNFRQSYPNLVPSSSAHPFMRRFDAYKDFKRQEREMSIGALLGRSVVDEQAMFTEQSRVFTDLTIDIEQNSPLQSPPSDEQKAFVQSRYLSYHHSLPHIPEEGSVFLSPHVNSSSSLPIERVFTPPLGHIKSPPPLSRQLSPYRESRMVESVVQQSQLRWGEPQEMSSMLLSVLKQQQIDYENDFYWLAKFQQEKIKRDLGERSVWNSGGAGSGGLGGGGGMGTAGAEGGIGGRVRSNVTFVDNRNVYIHSTPHYSRLPEEENERASEDMQVEMSSI